MVLLWKMVLGKPPARSVIDRSLAITRQLLVADNVVRLFLLHVQESIVLQPSRDVGRNSLWEQN